MGRDETCVSSGGRAKNDHKQTLFKNFDHLASTSQVGSHGRRTFIHTVGGSKFVGRQEFDQTSKKVQSYAETPALYVIPNSLANTFHFIASHSRASDVKRVCRSQLKKSSKITCGYIHNPFSYF